MKLAFQVPIPNMDDFIGDADFFFALAPLVLADEKYCNWFIDRPTLLDNGVHEHGTSVSLVDLLQAKTMLGNDCMIIPPDVLFDAGATLRSFYDACELLGSVHGVWPVLQGKTWSSLMHLIEGYSMEHVRRICVPYRLGTLIRVQLARELSSWAGLGVHFLGLNSIEELKALRFNADASLDTGKPFRWAQQNTTWPDGQIRKQKLNMHVSVDIRAAREGIRRMREVIDFDTTA
jgi:hypothetical protein